MSNKIGIHFGALAQLLADQLSGYNISPDLVEHYQMDADSITRLVVRGIIPAGEAEKARKRLVKKIGEKQNG